MSTIEFLKQLPDAIKPDAAAGVHCTVQFNTASTAHATIDDGSCSVEEGQADAPDVTLIIDDDDLIALFKGELDGMNAFMTGKLKVEGDVMRAQQIAGYFDTQKLG